MKQIKLYCCLLLISLCMACENKQEENPFFGNYTTPFEVPSFDQIKTEHYKPAFIKGLEEEKAIVAGVISSKEEPTFENTILPLDQGSPLFKRVASVFFGQNGANTNADLQALNREIAPMLSKHSDDISLNEALFKRIKTIYDNIESLNLSKEQKKLVTESYKGFARGGALLSKEDQEKLRGYNETISKLQVLFGQNMLAETNAFKLVIDNPADLSGLPASLVEAAAADAITAGDSGKWVFTCQNPSIMPFLQYADNRELRKKLLQAYLNRCNNGNENDNKELILQLVEARMKKAQLMGFSSMADFILDERMAKNSANVYDLLDQVWAPTMVVAKQELAELEAVAKKENCSLPLEPWDWRYYSEKVMKSRFELDENELRPYFSLDNVRKGIFYVCQQLYGITFEEVKDVPLPHPDAIAYKCKDQDGTHLGLVYMDFFPRASKRGGAWCGGYRSQTYKDGQRVAPVVTVVCNFTKPTAEAPSLLSLDETETFFHEFGHALHNLFKDVHYYGVSGVPRDFVELPSQIMEHWCFEPAVLKQYALHYQTNEAIPETLVNKIIAGAKFGQGFKTAEYLGASYLDMDFHVLNAMPAQLDVVKFEAETLGKRGLISQIPPRYRTTYFNHTWSGGYTAGYYSYIWAEVLDCDAYDAFVSSGDIFNKEIAAKFRKEILAPGGIEDAMQMYINFRGSKPGIEPLLKNRGLDKAGK